MTRRWSPEQQRALTLIAQALDEPAAVPQRGLYLSGKPGTGKSAVMLQATAAADKAGYMVFIGCPTGALVAHYQQNLPAGLKTVTVQTLHAAFRLPLEPLLDYSPPGSCKGTKCFSSPLPLLRLCYAACMLLVSVSLLARAPHLSALPLALSATRTAATLRPLHL